MKSHNLFFLLSLVLISCQQETKVAADTSAVQKIEPSADVVFDKKKDESCDTEEDLEKQIEEAKKKPEAFKLQGGDSGCSTDP